MVVFNTIYPTIVAPLFNKCATSVGAPFTAVQHHDDDDNDDDDDDDDDDD